MIDGDVSSLLLMNLNHLYYYHAWVGEKSKGLAKWCLPHFADCAASHPSCGLHRLSSSCPAPHLCDQCVSCLMPLDPRSSCHT